MIDIQCRTKVYQYGFLFMALLFSSFQGNAQTEFDRWAERVNWDGVTPWQYYIITSPAFMGPNALPVPRLQKGQLKDEIAWEIRPEWYVGKGDRTFDLFTHLYLPFAGGKVAIEGTMVMREWYQMDAETRDLRRARTESGRGIANGDVHVSTLIQVWKDKGKWPDGLISINLKTASGERLSDARYNDAGGYSFDLSLGKDISLGEHARLRWHTTVGFYVWQVYTRLQQQNDAISYGAGLDLVFKNWYVEQSLSGYAGYMDNGDKPLVYIAQTGLRLKQWELNAMFKYGFVDFPFRHVSIGFIRYFSQKKT